jgi:hypothetical protein
MTDSADVTTAPAITTTTSTITTTTESSTTTGPRYVKAEVVTSPDVQATATRRGATAVTRTIRVGRETPHTVQFKYQAGELKTQQVRSEIRRILGE